MYEVIEIGMASYSRLYDYHIRDVYGADFSLKGFDRPWLMEAHAWQRGEKVLDVGAAYSSVPIDLQAKHGLEVWVADDYGLKSNEPFWTRNRSPQEHIAAHPEVKFVLERLGSADSTLPENYFDVVYSLSALEHVPGPLTPAVWAHMDRLLKPGGEMIHAIDLPFPNNSGLGGLLKVLAFDACSPVLPAGLRHRYQLASARTYLKLAFGPIRVRSFPTAGLSPLRMAFEPDILTENPVHGLNRILKDGNKDFRYTRIGSLLVHIRKAA